jgi:hypothetical protein
MLTLFPFEPPIYADAGIAVSFVGHPMAQHAAGPGTRPLSDRVKQVARFYGADLVGICEVNPLWVYSDYFDRETGAYGTSSAKELKEMLDELLLLHDLELLLELEEKLELLELDEKLELLELDEEDELGINIQFALLFPSSMQVPSLTYVRLVAVESLTRRYEIVIPAGIVKVYREVGVLELNLTRFPDEPSQSPVV